MNSRGVTFINIHKIQKKVKLEKRKKKVDKNRSTTVAVSQYLVHLNKPTKQI